MRSQRSHGKISNHQTIKKLNMGCLLSPKKVFTNLRNIISLRLFWMCLLLALCSGCYADTSTPSEKIIAGRLAFINQIVSILSQNIPNTNSHMTITRVYTTTEYGETMNNVIINPKHAQMAGYSISAGGFNVNAITSTQMSSQLDAISKGSERNWKKVLILLGGSTMLPFSQFSSVITTFAKLAPTSALPATARAYILSAMSDASAAISSSAISSKAYVGASADAKLAKLKLAGDRLIAAEKAGMEKREVSSNKKP